MSKVLVEIDIPIAQKVFEVFLPLHLTGFELLPLIIRTAEDLTDGIFSASEETTLSRKEDGSLLNLNLPVWRLEVKNGEKFVLI